MALPGSGQICFSQLRSEFGYSGQVCMSTFYNNRYTCRDPRNYCMSSWRGYQHSACAVAKTVYWTLYEDAYYGWLRIYKNGLMVVNQAGDYGNEFNGTLYSGSFTYNVGDYIYVSLSSTSGGCCYPIPNLSVYDTINGQLFSGSLTGDNLYGTQQLDFGNFYPTGDVYIDGSASQ